MSAFPHTPTKLLTRIASEVSGEADEAAWMEFFELYEPVMRDYVRRHGLEDAEDVVQTVFARLVPILREGCYDRNRGPFRAYLSTLLCHETITTLRREMARGAGRKLSVEGMEIPVTEDPAFGLEAEWRDLRHRAAVRHVIDRTALSEQSRTVYDDLERTGDSCAEVAGRHGLSPAAVRQIKSRVSRMVAAYERLLGGEP